MESNEHLLEAAALAHALQVQLLIAVVFMAHDADRFLDHVRQFAALRRRMGSLLQRGARATYGRRRTARSRL